MFTADDDSQGLRYLRVASSLRKKMQDGVYRPGERLPRQHDLAKDYNVAFTTLKRALDVLELEGYVVRKVGQGTYAALPQEHIPSALVVDDDENVRNFFARVSEGSGWNSVVAESGEAALAKLKTQRFDVIFLDLIMPVMNGAETLREIRKTDQDTYVVIITGYPDSDLMWEALEIGPFAVMKKPIGLKDLRMVLGNVAKGSPSASGQQR